MRTKYMIFVLLVLMLSYCVGNSFGGPPILDMSITSGLTGIPNSLAYRLAAIESHFFRCEGWYGDGGSNTLSDTSFTPMVITTGTGGAYGAFVQIYSGSEILSGDPSKKMAINRLLVSDVSHTKKMYRIQFAFGTTTSGEATIGANTIGVFHSKEGATNQFQVSCHRFPANNKVWARVAGEEDSSTISFFAGVNKFDG